MSDLPNDALIGKDGARSACGPSSVLGLRRATRGMSVMIHTSGTLVTSHKGYGD